MPSSGNVFEVIDADGHVVEPDTVWKEYSEPAYREQLDQPGGGVQALGMRRAYPGAATVAGGRVRVKTGPRMWAGRLGTRSRAPR